MLRQQARRAAAAGGPRAARGSTLFSLASTAPVAAPRSHAASLRRAPVRFRYRQRRRGSGIAANMGHELYPFIKAGTIAPPVWFDALRLYPPANLFRGAHPGPIVFPEDRLLARLLKRMPVLRLEDRQVDAAEQPLAVRFVLRQWELMQDGVDEEEAFESCEDHFAADLQAFDLSLRSLGSSSSPVVDEEGMEEIEANVERRLRELTRRKGVVTTAEDQYELELLQHYMGQEPDLPRKHDYAVADMLFDAKHVTWGRSSVEAVLRDSLRMTERERYEITVLINRLLKPLDAVLEAAPGAQAVAREVNVLRVVEHLLQFPAYVKGYAKAGPDAGKRAVAHLLDEIDEYLVRAQKSEAPLPAEAETEAGAEAGAEAAAAAAAAAEEEGAPGLAAPAASAVFGDDEAVAVDIDFGDSPVEFGDALDDYATPEASLEGVVDAELLDAVREARESVRAVRERVADGYEAPDVEDNVVGLAEDGETHVLIGNRSGETPVVSRPYRHTMIEVMHSAYLHARERQNAIVKVRNKKKWRATRKNKQARLKMLVEAPFWAALTRATESHFEGAGQAHREFVARAKGAEAAEAEAAAEEARYKKVLADVQAVRTNRGLNRIFSQ